MTIMIRMVGEQHTFTDNLSVVKSMTLFPKERIQLLKKKKKKEVFSLAYFLNPLHFLVTNVNLCYMFVILLFSLDF